MAGHTFVVMGDIEHFACDAFLSATDRMLRKGGRWESVAPDVSQRLDPDLRADFTAERRFTLPLAARRGQTREPAVVLTAVPLHGVTTAADIRPRLREFFQVATDIANERRVTHELSNREKPLLAVPLFGSGKGGGGAIQGALLKALFAESRHATETLDVDVAIVLRNDRAYALAQMLRQESAANWPELSHDLFTHSRELGAIARDAHLVPFMGAGVSVSAGAPTWEQLIGRLAHAAGIEDAIVDTLLKRHDALDQAAYVLQAFEDRDANGRRAFADEIVTAVNMPRYGLAPALLATLDAEQAITLNYDLLFEAAARDSHRERRVIPGSASDARRWLLKLHGSVDQKDSIVLTRDDYLGFHADRAALSSLVKATLMTRHLLFVGFGMGDPHFHEIVHDVRRALTGRQQQFGTVLTLSNDEVTQRLWKHQLAFIHLESGRHLEIFLDAVLAQSATANNYLLADSYVSVLDSADAELRSALLTLRATVSENARESASWPAVRQLLHDLGVDDEA